MPVSQYADRDPRSGSRPVYPPEFPMFAIGIPTLNRWDLLRPVLWKYVHDFPHIDIFVLDNGNQRKEIQRPQIHYINQAENIGVAASWNVLCKMIYEKGNAFALIVNDDVYLGRNEYEIGNLLHFQKGFFFRAPMDWCSFIAPKQTYLAVGPFDENFKAYYEDNDYEYRLKLAGMGFTRWDMLSPMLYRKNSSLEKNSDVLNWSIQGRNYYIEKWGGEPGAEKFTIAFDGTK
jgi:GT2 family glycosyltransferase